MATASSPAPKHYCPNHSKKEVEYYCQTCSLELCSKCIYRDHKDHKTLDFEKEFLKSQQTIKNKSDNLENILDGLFEESKKLKSFYDEACSKIIEETEKCISDLRTHCKNRQKDIKRDFDKNDLKLKNVMTQIQNIKTDLDTSCLVTTEEPSITRMCSLNKLKDLQKLCENTKTDIPPVTYVEWRERSVKVCNILGSTVTKTLYSSKHCDRSRCGTCKHMHIAYFFKSNETGETFFLTDELSCTDHNLIYLISCKKCGKQFIGQTQNELRHRLNDYRSDIVKCKNKTISNHFNSADHSVKDLLIMPIEQIELKETRIAREQYWIRRLKTRLNI